jgi:hypothetical protein
VNWISAFKAILTLDDQAWTRSLATAASSASASASTSSNSAATSSSGAIRQSLSEKLAAGPDLDDFIAGNEDLVEAAVKGPARVAMGNTTQCA